MSHGASMTSRSSELSVHPSTQPSSTSAPAPSSAPTRRPTVEPVRRPPRPRSHRRLWDEDSSSSSDAATPAEFPAPVLEPSQRSTTDAYRDSTPASTTSTPSLERRSRMLLHTSRNTRAPDRQPRPVRLGLTRQYVHTRPHVPGEDSDGDSDEDGRMSLDSEPIERPSSPPPAAAAQMSPRHNDTTGPIETVDVRSPESTRPPLARPSPHRSTHGTTPEVLNLETVSTGTPTGLHTGPSADAMDDPPTRRDGSGRVEETAVQLARGRGEEARPSLSEAPSLERSPDTSPATVEPTGDGVEVPRRVRSFNPLQRPGHPRSAAPLTDHRSTTERSNPVRTQQRSPARRTSAPVRPLVDNGLPSNAVPAHWHLLADWAEWLRGQEERERDFRRLLSEGDLHTPHDHTGMLSPTVVPPAGRDPSSAATDRHEATATRTVPEQTVTRPGAVADPGMSPQPAHTRDTSLHHLHQPFVATPPAPYAGEDVRQPRRRALRAPGHRPHTNDSSGPRPDQPTTGDTRADHRITSGPVFTVDRPQRDAHTDDPQTQPPDGRVSMLNTDRHRRMLDAHQRVMRFKVAPHCFYHEVAKTIMRHLTKVKDGGPTSGEYDDSSKKLLVGRASTHTDTTRLALNLPDSKSSLPTVSTSSWLEAGVRWTGTQCADVRKHLSAYSTVTVGPVRSPPQGLGQSLGRVPRDGDADGVPGTRTKPDPEQDIWPVRVTLDTVDWKTKTVAGTMDASEIPARILTVPHVQRLASRRTVADGSRTDDARSDTVEPADTPSTEADPHLGRPVDTANVKSFFEGEIVDFDRFGLESPFGHNGWPVGGTGADVNYWSRLGPFRIRVEEACEALWSEKAATTTVEKEAALAAVDEAEVAETMNETMAACLGDQDWMREQLGRHWTLMRWKERFFLTDDQPTSSSRTWSGSSETTAVPRPTAPQISPCGTHLSFPERPWWQLSIGGFYYVALHRLSGRIEALYFDHSLEPSQRLRMAPGNGGDGDARPSRSASRSASPCDELSVGGIRRSFPVVELR